MKDIDLFTQPPEPKAEKKPAVDALEDYLVKRNRLISEQYYGGGPIIDNQKK